MNQYDLATIVAGLHGLMPESARTELAVRLAQLLERSITNPLNALLRDQWRKWGMAGFMQRCALTTTVRPVVPYRFHVEETALAEFCNRWMNVSAFRLADEPDDATRPITPELNGLRVTMITELKALAEKAT